MASGSGRGVIQAGAVGFWRLGFGSEASASVAARIAAPGTASSSARLVRHHPVNFGARRAVVREGATTK
jgi:hypothetical protein